MSFMLLSHHLTVHVIKSVSTFFWVRKYQKSNKDSLVTYLTYALCSTVWLKCLSMTICWVSNITIICTIRDKSWVHSVQVQILYVCEGLVLKNATRCFVNDIYFYWTQLGMMLGNIILSIEFTYSLGAKLVEQFALSEENHFMLK